MKIGGIILIAWFSFLIWAVATGQGGGHVEFIDGKRVPIFNKHEHERAIEIFVDRRE